MEKKNNGRKRGWMRGGRGRWERELRFLEMVFDVRRTHNAVDRNAERMTKLIHFIRRQYFHLTRIKWMHVNSTRHYVTRNIVSMDPVHRLPLQREWKVKIGNAKLCDIVVVGRRRWWHWHWHQHHCVSIEPFGSQSNFACIFRWTEKGMRAINDDGTEIQFRLTGFWVSFSLSFSLALFCHRMS